MKRALLMAGAVVGASTALAQAPAPSLKFLAAPAAEGVAEEVAVPLPQVSRIVQGKSMTVIVKESAPCGERASEPAFKLDGNTLRLSYDLTTAGVAPGAHGCVATSVFTLHNLPAPAANELEIAEFGPISEGHALPVVSAGPVGMRFVGTPAVAGMGETKREIVQSRHADRMTVVVYEPAACGSRPIEPAASVSDGALNLRFKLTAGGAGGAAPCVATAVFALRNLPQGELKIAVDAGKKEAAPVLAAANSELMGLRFFVGVPATAATGESKREIVQSHRGDRMTVVVTDPAACGSRPVEPAATISGGTLHLQYSLAAAVESAEGPCTATAVFALHHVPDRDLKLAVDTNYLKVMQATGMPAGPQPEKVVHVPAAGN